MYPLISIDLAKLSHNIKTIITLSQKANINSIFGVVKVLAGDIETINCLTSSGITHVADSRIQNLKNIDTNLLKVLVRLPMLSEVREVVKYCDISLNSELETIKALDKAAQNLHKIHEIILMFDLGDLREGVWFKSDYLNIVAEILNLKNIKLSGIGTNLTCYGSIIPTFDNLSILSSIKENIENYFNIKLAIISGGNSSSLPLVFSKNIPNGINNLRIGEAFYLGRETAYCQAIDNCFQDVFTLKAQIIELKTKPSFPIGIRGVDAFGQTVQYEDKGIMKRAILGIGRQDVYPGNIEPLDEKLHILGASSDHLIIDCTNTDYKLGDVISFRMNYGGLLSLMTSKYVNKIYIKN